jgi:hypothetical protein
MTPVSKPKQWKSPEARSKKAEKRAQLAARHKAKQAAKQAARIQANYPPNREQEPSSAASYEPANTMAYDPSPPRGPRAERREPSATYFSSASAYAREPRGRSRSLSPRGRKVSDANYSSYKENNYRPSYDRDRRESPPREGRRRRNSSPRDRFEPRRERERERERERDLFDSVGRTLAFNNIL